jgi:hypothetical protein
MDLDITLALLCQEKNAPLHFSSTLHCGIDALSGQLNAVAFSSKNSNTMASSACPLYGGLPIMDAPSIESVEL